MKHMKRLTAGCLCILPALVALPLYAQTPAPQSSASQLSALPISASPRPPPPSRITDAGPNHRVWQRTDYETRPDGTVVPHLHQYTELASGLEYQENGRWVASVEQIEPYPAGAIARQGQYQVIFANNLNSEGAIDQQTPDAKRLRSNILGLAYYDHASGQTVLIAQVQDSTGDDLRQPSPLPQRLHRRPGRHPVHLQKRLLRAGRHLPRAAPPRNPSV